MDLNSDFIDHIRTYLPNLSGIENLIEFNGMCLSAQRPEDFFHLVEYYKNKDRLHLLGFTKTIFNNLIGWALPSREACSLVVSAWRTRSKIHPECRIIDVGAGSGVYCHIFHELGVPKDNIVAYDLEKPTHTSPGQRNFFPITTTNLVVRSTNIIFMAWPCFGENRVPVWSDYIKQGGDCIIIQGEIDGCTSPCADHYQEETSWTTEMYPVPGAAVYDHEYLSINIRTIK